MLIDIPEFRFMNEANRAITAEWFLRELVTLHNREMDELKREIEQLKKEIENGKKTD